MKKILGLTLVAVLSLALAAPVSAGGRGGGGGHGGFRGGVRSGFCTAPDSLDTLGGCPCTHLSTPAPMLHARPASAR